MNTVFKMAAAFAASFVFVFFTGCENDGGGGGDDVGDNNPDLVICVGDSITQGYECGGAPYPSVLSSLTHKTCRNAGSGGATSSAGVAKVRSSLSAKPGYMCILFGANDAICGTDPAVTGDRIRSMISMCKANKTIPIVATTPPMIGEHEIFNGGARGVNEAIKRVAGEEGVTCVDLYGAFGSGEAYLTRDGLHPNAAGQELIAKCFAGAL